MKKTPLRLNLHALVRAIANVQAEERVEMAGLLDPNGNSTNTAEFDRVGRVAWRVWRSQWKEGVSSQEQQRLAASAVALFDAGFGFPSGMACHVFKKLTDADAIEHLMGVFSANLEQEREKSGYKKANDATGWHAGEKAWVWWFIEQKELDASLKSFFEYWEQCEKSSHESGRLFLNDTAPKAFWLLVLSKGFLWLPWLAEKENSAWRGILGNLNFNIKLRLYNGAKSNSELTSIHPKIQQDNRKIAEDVFSRMEERTREMCVAWSELRNERNFPNDIASWGDWLVLSTKSRGGKTAPCAL